MVDGSVDLRLWGKSRGLPQPYPLLWHLVDTAGVAGALWDKFLTVSQRRILVNGLGTDEEHARVLVMFWAGLHDLGKATPGFQAQDLQAFQGLAADPLYGPGGSRDLRHEKATQLGLLNLLKPLGYSTAGLASSQPCYRVAQMLGGHHGRFRRVGRFDPDMRQLGGEGWAAQRTELVNLLQQALGSPKPPTVVDSGTAVLLTGLIILADWLASQESFLARQLRLVPTAATPEIVIRRLVALQSEAGELVGNAGLGIAELRSAGFRDIFSFSPNALQRSILEELLPSLDGPGLLLVTAATGDGKTEAALAAAQALAAASGANGFYFALPTMATADQMYQRVRRFAAQVAQGSAPVTLLHSMSWLNAAYDRQSIAGIDGEERVSTEDQDAYVEVPNWLRGRKRGLLAPLSVGTVDQALIAAMTTKHNALRLLGLSGKVFIVDEAHAYDDYMQRVLGVLLTWLGAYRCPVLLLSATLPTSQARKLISAYQRGTGSSTAVPDRIDYPGWTFVPADPGRPALTISRRAQAAVTQHRAFNLVVDVRPVKHLSGPETDPLDRRVIIRSSLAPLLSEGGSAGVVCNTVADAQDTYEMLREWAANRVELVLLHSRFPAYQREAITEKVTSQLGKDGDRSKPLIVIATQVIEQSLDLDFDLLISDLAPLAQLLQRAGRCHRHQHPRPSYADRPRLIVLDPHDQAGYRPPRHWGNVYSPYLLRATHLRLAGLTQIPIPQSVQEHMEAVYGPPTVDDPDLAAEYAEYRGEGMAKRQLADLVVIPEAGNIGDLSLLSENPVSDVQATTRFGADSVRIVCCYVDGEGGHWLDPSRKHPLPVPAAKSGRLSGDEVREILRHSIPVRQSLVDGYTSPIELPGWQANPWLSELFPLWFQVERGTAAPLRVGRRYLWLDEHLGLVMKYAADP